MGTINVNRGQWFGVHQPPSVWKHTMSKARQLKEWALGANNHCLAREMYGNTLRLTCLGPPSGRLAPVETSSHPLLSGSIGFVGIQARSTGQAVGRVEQWQWQPWGAEWGGSLKERHTVSQDKTWEAMACLLLSAMCVLLYAWSKTVTETER